jgi:dTDP-4-amino-4,6-dideoxygalactose transaminase
VRVPQSDYSDVSPFIYSLRVLGGKREELIAHLNTLEIDSGVHFIPVHKHTHFAHARRGDMSVTERVTAEVLTLPLHSNMKQDFVERVIAGVRSFFA